MSSTFAWGISSYPSLISSLAFSDTTFQTLGADVSIKVKGYFRGAIMGIKYH